MINRLNFTSKKLINQGLIPDIHVQFILLLIPIIKA